MRPNPVPVPRLLVLAALLTLLLAVAVGYVMLMPPNATLIRYRSYDKLLHFLAFFVLILPLASVMSARLAVGVAVVIAIVYGGAIEIAQPYVGRGAEWADFVADALGAVCGAALGRWLRLRLKARAAPPVTTGAAGSAGSSPSPSSAGPR